MTTEPLSKESQPASEKEGETAEGKRAMEQAHDAIDNVSQGYGNTPSSSSSDVDKPSAPHASDPPNRFESPAEKSTEPTHVTVRDADRR